MSEVIATVGRKPTLKSIAEQLGVSKATVSNVFNRPEVVSEALREKILSHCQDVGYSGPSITARSLTTGKTNVVGVLLSDTIAFNFTDPAASQFMAGVGQALDEHHASMLLLPTSERHYANSQVETMPDSFIVYGRPLEAELLPRLVRQGKPLVTVDFNTPKNHGLVVSINDRDGACEVAHHALSSFMAAHKRKPRVAVLGLRLSAVETPGPVDTSQLYDPDESISRRRLDGYWDALEAMQVELPDSRIWHLPWMDSASIRMMVRGFLTEKPAQRPEVLLCMSDKIAIAAMSAARDLGLRIPADLRIVGFDNTQAAEQWGLTTVEQPLEEKGRAAAHLAIGLPPQAPVELKTRLVIRESA